MKKSYEQLENSVNFYRALMVLLLIVIATAVYTIDGQEDRITELDANQSKCGGYEDSEQRFQNTLKVLLIQNDRVDELEVANEALMHELDKRNGLIKAIKCTPMPKMKRV